MKIGILGGTGRMGRGLARGYAKAGHEVFLGARNPEKAIKAAAAIEGNVSGGTLDDAAQEGDVIVLAVPFREAADVVRRQQDRLAGKIVVDITNPFGAVSPGQTSGIEHNAQAAGTARWVAAYKTNFWKTLEQPALANGIRHDVLVCSDDENAKQAVMQLIEQTEFHAVDCGKLQNARTLDLMVPLMLELDHRYSYDALSSWKFLHADG
jgi:NADPH-dependent F420 reductase